tara:strand:- start:176 stop:1072 length:897 start_codon:yes stop_codon:yes gene_type:complete
MAVPSSGEISLGKVRQELEMTSTSDDYNDGPFTSSETSLSASQVGTYEAINTGSINRPDSNAPYKMSEWHGYDHDFAWNIDWSSNLKLGLVLSGSKSAQNTAPNNTVADQQVVSFTITNPSAAAPSRPGGGSWDESSEPRTNYVYVYISDDHVNNIPPAGPYVDSGSVSIAMGAGQDPGVTGLGAGAGGYSKVGGTGWIATRRFGGTDPTDSDFLDVDGSAASNDPPFLLNVARLFINTTSFQSSSYFVRMAYSGSGANTFGNHFGTQGVVGTFHSRSIHVINGPYSSSFDFKTTIVS